MTMPPGQIPGRLPSGVIFFGNIRVTQPCSPFALNATRPFLHDHHLSPLHLSPIPPSLPSPPFSPLPLSLLSLPYVLS